MAEIDKKSVFQAFTEKAVQRLKEKKTRKTETLYVPSLDENIKIQSLIYPEIVECMEMEDENDPNAADKYSIYLAVVEPDLKAVAVKLREMGEIGEYLEVVNIFNMGEVSEIAMEVMKLSGVTGSRKVTVVEELKN